MRSVQIGLCRLHTAEGGKRHRFALSHPLESHPRNLPTALCTHARALAHVRTGLSYLPRTNLQSVTGQLCAKHYFLRRVENAQLESRSTADFRPDSTGATQHALANTKTTLALSFLSRKLNVEKETKCRQLRIPLVFNKSCRGRKT